MKHEGQSFQRPGNKGVRGVNVWRQEMRMTAKVKAILNQTKVQ